MDSFTDTRGLVQPARLASHHDGRLTLEAQGIQFLDTGEVSVGPGEALRQSKKICDWRIGHRQRRAKDNRFRWH
ncbi:MAG: hypothetical protein AAF636_25545 [Pseudomonadota bacterium]